MRLGRVVGAVLVWCCVGARAGDPEWYAKRGTWHETVMASVEGARKSGEVVASVPLPDLGRSDFTILAWVRTTRGGTLLAKAPAKGAWAQQAKSLFIERGRLCYDIGWVGCVRSRRRVADGAWHHVGLAKRGESLRMYIDGEADESAELRGGPDVRGHVAKIGYTSRNFPEHVQPAFIGDLDDLRLYARTLTAAEVKAHAAGPQPTRADGLAGCWPFDGGLDDASGSGHAAVGSGKAAFVEGRAGKALRLGGGKGLRIPSRDTWFRDLLWALVERDFADAASRREMASEREDGIWAAGWPASAPALGARYARACGREPGVAEKAARLAKAIKDMADVGRIRELYLRSRRIAEAREALPELRIGGLRGAIAHLTETYGEAYPRGEGFLARLDALEKELTEAVERGGESGVALARLAEAIETLSREALLVHNPLLDFQKLLFVKRQTYHSSHFYTDFIDGCSRYGGNLCVLDLPSGQVADLVPEMKDGIFGRFDLHFTATKVVFDWKKAPKEGFRIYEIDIDPKTGARTGGPRQLTFPPDDEAARIRKYDNSFIGGTARMYYHQTDDMHPCYLPDGGIVFASSRCEYGTLCDSPDALATTVLHRMDGDGSHITKLTNSPVSEFSPSMMADGRVLYTRWEYVDKGQLGIKCLWAMHPDGSGSVEIYGNDIRVPPSFLHGRQIPGYANLFVFLGTPHYPQSGIGTVIRADMTKPIRTREPMTYITPHVDIRQEPGWNHLVDGKWVRHTRGPLYMDPYPLSREVFLVSHNPDKPWNDPKAYGLCLLTESGAHQWVHRDPAISCWEPYPLRPRPTPPVLPSALDPKLAARNLAVCLVQDVHHGMEGIRPGEVKYLRVMEQLPRPWDARRFWDQRSRYNGHTNLVSRGKAIAAKAMWGVVPVREDGSAHFYVPANRNIYFQALDANYMELQRERTYVNYMPGERRSCVGCHDTPDDTPHGRRAAPLALGERPVLPGPQPGDTTGRQVLHFPSYVQPVLDKFCVKCHGGAKPKAGLDLTHQLTTHFSRSYERLLRMVPTYAEASDWDGSPYAPPKSIGSHRSRLIRALREGKGHTELELPQWAFVRFATWVDASGVYYGSYWGRRHIRFKGHPFFRPVPTFAEAISPTCSVPVENR